MVYICVSVCMYIMYMCMIYFKKLASRILGAIKSKIHRAR